MTRNVLLRIAAALVLLTAVAHTIGFVQSGKIMPGQPEITATRAATGATVVPMPIGPARTMLQLSEGGSLFVTLYLVITGLMLVFLAKRDKTTNAELLATSLGLIGCAAISWFYFFPLPAAFTGIAGILGFIALKR